MNVQGPPIHYPSSHESTSAVYRTRPSVSEGTPGCSRYQPPAYGSERAPPQYNERTNETGEEENLKAKSRKTILIRLFTAIFIMVIIALIVAGVVGRINAIQSQEDEEETMTTPTKTNLVFKAPSSVLNTQVQSALALTTPAPSMTLETTAVANATSSTPTSSATTSDVMAEMKLANGGSFREANDDVPSNDPGPLDVSIYSYHECLLEKSSFKGDLDETLYRCTMACGSVNLDGDLAGEVIVDDWEWDCG